MLVIGVTYVAINTAADVLVRAIDPRLAEPA